MKNLLLLLGLFVFAGCKTVHYDRSQVLNRQNDIAVLKERVDSAVAKDVDVLAPKHFAEAKEVLDKSISEAQKSEDPRAGNDTARLGLEKLNQAEEKAEEARATLSEALTSRLKAQEAQADLLYESDFHSLEKKLLAAATAIEGNDKKRGIEQNVDLDRAYAELEVKALKSNLAEQAEKAYNDAVKVGAAKLAPITLQKAKNELEVAKKIVDIEKGNYEQARSRAEEARYQARRAQYISEILIGFKKGKLTDEEIVLWYQNQLSAIHKHMPTDIRFDVDNKDVIGRFDADLKSGMDHLKSLESRAVASERRTAKLSDELANSAKDKASQLALSKAKEQIFHDVSDLFDANEAEVVKKGNDVIIRLYGFYFPVGKADLLPQNFSLLNKIAVAIVKYPNASVDVEGHTDATGSKNVNMRLSKERAQNVAQFLTKVSGIEAERVKSAGLGSDRPLFRNDTEANRAKNRRIEVIIVNP